MGNPFKFFLTRDNTTHRLTDIETEEVSLVDKGANKRKFAVVKRDLETNEMSKGPEMFEDINKTESVTATSETVKVETPVAPVDEKASAILEGLTTGLEKLASLTELVKSHVEKAEVATDEALATWQTAMTDVTAWADKTMKSYFVKAEEVVQTAATETTAVTSEEVKTQETVVAADAVTKNEDSATKTEVAKSATEILTDIQTTILDLASTVPTAESVKAAVTKMDGLFVSGGLYIDAYDVEALAAVCNAVCDAMCVGDDAAAMKKSADKILAEISKRTVAVTKRVAKANATTSADGKELKIASLMLKALENGLTESTTTESTMATTTNTPVIDEAAVAALVDAAVTKAVGTAVAKAVEELNKQNSTLATQVETLKAEKVELNKKLTASMAEPQSRGSSAETVTKNDVSVELFPLDYNAPSFAELNK